MKAHALPLGAAVSLLLAAAGGCSGSIAGDGGGDNPKVEEDGGSVEGDDLSPGDSGPGDAPGDLGPGDAPGDPGIAGDDAGGDTFYPQPECATTTPRSAWAVRLGGTSWDGATAVGVTTAGNTWTTGTASRGFEAAQVGEACGVPVDWVSNWDVFVALHDPNGCLLEAGITGAAGRHQVEDLAVADDGGALVIGTSGGEAVFGAGQANQTSPTCFGAEDIYLARFAPDGSFDWVATAGGPHLDWGEAVAGLPGGGAVVTGRFVGTAVFGSGESNETTLVAVDPPPPIPTPGGLRDLGTVDGFVARFASDGSLMWAMPTGGDDGDYPTGIAAAGLNGASVVVGYFMTTITLGSGPGAVTLTAATAGELDGFVALLDENGMPTWAQRIAHGRARGVLVRTDGSVVVAGTASALGATFDPGGPAESTLTGSDAFLAAYTAGGAPLWQQGTVTSRALRVAGDGTLILGGTLTGPAPFGVGSGNEVTLTPTGTRAPFLAGYDGGGTFNWAAHAADAEVFLSDFSLHPGGEITIAGSVNATADIFSGEPMTTELAPRGGSDAFVARFADQQLGAGNALACSAVAVDGVCPAHAPCVGGGCQPLFCPGPGEPACGDSTELSTLPGVRIEFPPQPCSYTLTEAAAGITIQYNVIVDQALADVLLDSADIGGCHSGAFIGGLELLASVGGNDQSYCICDTGPCGFPPPPVPSSVAPGSFPATFEWTGVNWYGPSDTMNPYGSPFPAGDYDVRVSSEGWLGNSCGYQGFSVSGTYRIELTP